MGRIILITALLSASACSSEPETFEYDGPELTCDCDDAAKMILVYNSCLTTNGRHLHAQCFNVACESACPIDIDWEDFG